MEKFTATSMPLPLLLFFGLFVVVGAGMWISLPWNLLTGGPRDRTKPGQPYVYDRLYYLLLLIGLIGWSVALLSILVPITRGRTDDVSGFLAGWGIMAVGMGLLFRLRREMMLSGARYLSKHGFILWRPYYAMQVKQRERQPLAWKYMPLAFLVIGIGVLIFTLPHVTEVPGQVTAGAAIVRDMIRRVAHGQV